MTCMEPDIPKLSVVIVVHDEASQLEDNLPRFLVQQCSFPYEVIVVDDSSSDDTPDVLQRMKTQYPHLYTTFIPKSVIFNPSRLRLAMNVGVKAAHSSWVVFCGIARPPKSDLWLSELAAQCSDDIDVVMTYSRRRTQENVFFQLFHQLDEARPLIMKAERCSGRGHSGNFLKYKRGHYDAVAIRRHCIQEAIALFDLPVKSIGIWRKRLYVLWKNM